MGCYITVLPNDSKPTWKYKLRNYLTIADKCPSMLIYHIPSLKSYILGNFKVSQERLCAFSNVVSTRELWLEI